MELNWPTFVLEIVNFLILIWILKRFLYKPVLDAIARRKAVIDKTLADTKARQSEARTLEEQYQSRLAAWEVEKETLRAGVREEVRRQREQMMTALKASLAQQREKARAVEEQQLKELQKEAAERGARLGAQFTGRLLERLASLELEAKIVELVLEDLSLLPAERLRAIKSVNRTGEHAVTVSSAFPLPPAQRNSISEKLRSVIQDRLAIEFKEDSRLLAGLRISIEPWVLHANVEDDLQFFTNALRHEPRNQ